MASLKKEERKILRKSLLLVPEIQVVLRVGIENKAQHGKSSTPEFWLEKESGVKGLGWGVEWATPLASVWRMNW